MVLAFRHGSERGLCNEDYQRQPSCPVSFRNRRWLLPGSGVVTGTSGNQAGDEGTEQGFAASACVVHELEEAEVEGQLVLRDATVRAQPSRIPSFRFLITVAETEFDLSLV